MTYKRGDFVMIGVEGREVKGMVMLASPNGRSLMLGFDAILAGCVGSMPVLLDDDGTYRCIVNGVEVTLRPA